MTWIRWMAISALTVLALMYGCDGKYFYDLSSDLARMRADLHRKSVSLGGHLHMEYAENTRTDPPTLVLLHGFSAQKEVWYPFARYVHRDDHLVIPDLIGDGESSHPMELDYSIEAHADRLHRFLTRLGIRHPILVGNSLGGSIALAYASRYPVEKLILIDPLGLERVPSALQKLGTHKAKELFLGICDRERMEHLIKVIYHDPPYIPGIMLDYMAQQKCRLSTLDIRKSHSIYRADGAWVFAERIPEYARAVSVPTLILWGDQDRINNPENAAAFHRLIAGSTLRFIKGAGHVPMMEAPRETARLVRDFLEVHAAPHPKGSPL